MVSFWFNIWIWFIFHILWEFLLFALSIYLLIFNFSGIRMLLLDFNLLFLLFYESSSIFLFCSRNPLNLEWLTLVFSLGFITLILSPLKLLLPIVFPNIIDLFSSIIDLFWSLLRLSFHRKIVLGVDYLEAIFIAYKSIG